MKVWACQSCDDILLRESSSGGVFTLLAREMFSRGGVVFGAAYRNGRCAHISAENEEELTALRGSKYLQSDTGNTFQQVKSLLENGMQVMYSGTPCQISSLKTFLNGQKDGLLTISLACHGVPEQKAWDAYIARFPAPPSKVSFRDKTDGWRRYSVRMYFPDGTEYREPHDKDPFLRAYLANLILRPACHVCKCCALNSKADITLGDDWGGVLTDGGDKGSSVVLAHTPEGEAMFGKVRGDMRVRETDFDTVAEANPALKDPVKPHPKREEFLRAVTPENFDALVNKWCKTPITARLKRAVKAVLKR